MTFVFKSSAKNFLKLISVPCFIGLLSAPSDAQQLIQPRPLFSSYVSSMQVVQNFSFGTDPSRNINNLSQLTSYFAPYGIAGTAPINQEWERYQPFNSTNFVFTPTALQLTATIPSGGGLYNGGINSAQIWSNWTLAPGMTGYGTYAIELRMKIPAGPGMWPGSFFFTKDYRYSDTSEIDNPEFLNMNTQNSFDWTANLKGPGVGANFYSIKTNQYAWVPGLDFSGDYHSYQTIWTPNAVYRFLDGTLIVADYFTWTAKGPAQLGVILAVGSDSPALPGLQPTSLSQFPIAVAVDHITVWGGNATSTVSNPTAPAALPFVSSTPVTGLRNNYSGFVGMQFTVGSGSLLVSQLGRFVAPGNSGSHVVKLANANGTDVPGGAVSVPTAGAAAGQYTYAALASPVTLLANTTYYLLSQELNGGDQWYEYGPLNTSTVASVNGPIYTDYGGNYILVYATGSSYVPPNFLFTPK